MAKDQTDDQHLPERVEAPPARSGSLPARVLLAEDDTAFRELLAEVLRRSGYEVLEAANGEELLDHVAFGLMRGESFRTFDLIVSDIRMPRHTGLEILTGMRSANLSVPVILITAFGDAETHRMAYELGARVLDKPFDMTELELAVAAAVSQAGKMQAARMPCGT
jgi:DNA-binding response OmpR family regulator